MLALSQCKKYEIDINSKSKGVLLISKFLKDISLYKIPFEDNNKMEIVKIGNGDYDDVDTFIVDSLNDYYKKLSSPSDVETKESMLSTYTKLYELWTSINHKKEENNIVELNELYGKLSYGLYLIGYEDNQL